MINPAVKNVYLHTIIFDLTIYIRIGIVFDLFVYKIHGDRVTGHFCAEQKFPTQGYMKWTLKGFLCSNLNQNTWLSKSIAPIFIFRAGYIVG